MKVQTFLHSSTQRDRDFEKLFSAEQSESESELHYNWRSVSQYVLVSSPIWDFWPEIFFFFFKFTVLSFGGALSDERSGLSVVSLLSIQSVVVSVFTYIIYNGIYIICEIGVVLAADSQSTSASGYRASLWDPWPDFILLFFLLVWQLHYYDFNTPSLTRKRSVVYSVITH
jgi:hypothetical protein